MSRNTIASNARGSELLDEQLEFVHGGIIIIGGKALQPSQSTLTFSGYALNTIVGRAQQPEYVI